METSNRKEEPIVSVGIVSASKLCFSLNAPYTVCGSQRFGKQVVELSEGRILWENTLYDELLFDPTDAQSSFTLEDVTIGVNFQWKTTISAPSTSCLLKLILPVSSLRKCVQHRRWNY